MESGIKIVGIWYLPLDMEDLDDKLILQSITRILYVVT